MSLIRVGDVVDGRGCRAVSEQQQMSEENLELEAVLPGGGLI